MKICKNCKAKIKEQVTVCEKCQTDQRSWIAQHPVLSGFIALIVVGMFINGATNSHNNGNLLSPTPAELKYKVLDKNETDTVENYKILVDPNDDGTKVALKVKETCNKPCNVDVFNNEEAANLAIELDSLYTSEKDAAKISAWKENNYIFVADHLVGTIMFDSEEYTKFPLKDWYYEEQKAK